MPPLCALYGENSILSQTFWFPIQPGQRPGLWQEREIRIKSEMKIQDGRGMLIAIAILRRVFYSKDYR